MEILEMCAEMGADITGWETDGYGLDSNFVCPCGRTLEQDGECPRCGPTPMRKAGLI